MHSYCNELRKFVTKRISFTAQRWEGDPELQPFIKKAEPTGLQLSTGAYSSVEQVKIEGEIYAAKRFRVMCNKSHEKFFAELRILCSIRHPNIVQCHCVCFLPNSKSPALVMEQLSTDLHAYLLNLFYAIANPPLHLKVHTLSSNIIPLVLVTKLTSIMQWASL